MSRDYCEACGYTDSHDPNCPRPRPSDTPRTDAAAVSREFIVREMDIYGQKFVLADFARRLESELTDARLVLALTRTILAGADAGSLPHDFPVDGMAAERMKDLLNTRRQLERELAAAIKAGESVQRDSNEMRRNLDSVREINATLEAKLTYLRSQRAGQMGEKLYKLEKELAELREELRLRHEADVKASAYAKHDTSPQVSHTNGDK